MSKVTKNDLIKIGLTTLIGLLAFSMIVFWLKGHKIRHYDQFTFYFKNVNGLEEGNALRWNGLKIGVVEKIRPVKESFIQDSLPADVLIELGKRHMEKAQKMLTTKKLEDLVTAQESINQAQLEIALGKASSSQTEIKAGQYVAVTVLVTVKDIPIGPLNQVTIVPSGLIGQQYVDIATVDIDDDYMKEFGSDKPRFVMLEPVRLDTLIRVNVESAEAITNFTNRLNALFDDEDAERLRLLIDSAGNIAADQQFKSDLKQTVNNINEITTDFNLWKFMFPKKMPGTKSVQGRTYHPVK